MHGGPLLWSFTKISLVRLPMTLRFSLERFDITSKFILNIKNGLPYGTAFLDFALLPSPQAWKPEAATKKKKRQLFKELRDLFQEA